MEKQSISDVLKGYMDLCNKRLREAKETKEIKQQIDYEGRKEAVKEIALRLELYGIISKEQLNNISG